MVKFTQTAPQGQGPSSSIGIQRFFDTDEGGPVLTPPMVIGAAIVVIILMLVLHGLA
ncbi:MAG: preprotein translocase subunit Sec61beta [Candidatus Diapherotrites archaeon]|nr:preprotein translocase subunit Sec61beta [Candidatus Diapherotrites archaeon]MDZ4256366.1 preprotein translocase subunit Sec61beta [archaeon]